MAIRRDSAAAPLFADLITKIKFRIISKDLWLPAMLLVAFQERFSKKKKKILLDSFMAQREHCTTT